MLTDVWGGERKRAGDLPFAGWPAPRYLAHCTGVYFIIFIFCSLYNFLNILFAFLFFFFQLIFFFLLVLDSHGVYNIYIFFVVFIFRLPGKGTRALGHARCVSGPDRAGLFVREMGLQGPAPFPFNNTKITMHVLIIFLILGGYEILFNLNELIFTSLAYVSFFVFFVFTSL